MARTVTTYPFGVAISIAGANLRFFLLCLLPYQNPVAFLGGYGLPLLPLWTTVIGCLEYRNITAHCWDENIMNKYVRLSAWSKILLWPITIYFIGGALVKGTIFFFNKGKKVCFWRWKIGQKPVWKSFFERFLLRFFSKKTLRQHVSKSFLSRFVAGLPAGIPNLFIYLWLGVSLSICYFRCVYLLCIGRRLGVQCSAAACFGLVYW